MVMVINRKITRTMLESKSQYLGSLVLIIISCLLFTMMTQLAGNMSALTAAFENDLTDRGAVDVDQQRRADRQIDLINLNFDLGAAAVQLVLRETGRQNAVDRAAGKSREQIAAVRRRARIRTA